MTVLPIASSPPGRHCAHERRRGRGARHARLLHAAPAAQAAPGRSATMTTPIISAPQKVIRLRCALSLAYASTICQLFGLCSARPISNSSNDNSSNDTSSMNSNNNDNHDNNN